MSAAEMEALRAKLQRGPWDNEPDSHEWEHAGISCAIRRNDSFVWCGYARAPESHPWYSLKMKDLTRIAIHGGITYAGHRGDSSGELNWWIGFDCNHHGDLSPLAQATHPAGRTFAGTYRDFGFAKQETERLAEQIAAVWPYPSCPMELFGRLVDSYFEVGADRGTSLLVYLTHTIAGAIGESHEPA